MQRSRSINRIDEPVPASILAKERLSAKTGERQRVSVARIVKSLASFTMRHKR
jgi:hypothetical protein